MVSDLRVFHRVDDWRSLDGPTFLSFAHRLPAYQGVMQARHAALQEEERKGVNGSTSSTTETKQVASTAAALRTDPDISAFGEIEVEE